MKRPMVRSRLHAALPPGHDDAQAPAGLPDSRPVLTPWPPLPSGEGGLHVTLIRLTLNQVAPAVGVFRPGHIAKALRGESRHEEVRRRDRHWGASDSAPFGVGMMLCPVRARIPWSGHLFGHRSLADTTFGLYCDLRGAVDSRDVIRALRRDGWVVVRIRGSHHQLAHPSKPGVVTVPHPRKHLARRLLRSIERQAGLRFGSEG
jgi:predicted RNA binding protein YcfA (HicA-like mRNA interferase family)